MTVTTAPAPHIDDLDPETTAFTLDGTTHIGVCPELMAVPEETRRNGTEISGLAEATGWLCGVCIDATPRIVNTVLEAANKGFGIPATTKGGHAYAAKPASDKAMAYLRSLAAETGTDLTTLADPDGKFSAKTASGLIDLLKKEAAAAAPVAGFYTNPAGVNVEVKISGTGNWYGMIDGEYVGRKVGGKLIPAEAPAAPAPEADGPVDGLDLSKIPSGRYAVPGGDTRLKVKIDNVEDGKWAGWIFVKDAAEYGAGTRYGSAKPGATYKGKIEAELAIIAADPYAAAAAYGKLVGKCGRCNRVLEDEDSVARGIGPVCMTKGW